MKKFLFVSALVLLCHAAIAQEGFSSIEERMTGKEFTGAGLDKLTDAELAALNDWLRAHSVATLDSASNRPASAARNVNLAVTTAAPATGSDSRGFENSKTDKNDIVARLKGTFDGWTGDTVFELDNGMVWKQDQTDRFFIRDVENPVVTIKATTFGAWRLQVEGYNKTVKVKRIQ